MPDLRRVGRGLAYPSFFHTGRELSRGVIFKSKKKTPLGHSWSADYAPKSYFWESPFCPFFMNKLREFYKQYGQYILSDGLMYLVFIVFIALLFVFFG